MSQADLLPVGRITKAHGIKGEVSVDYYADSPSLLREGVYLAKPGADPASAVFHEVAAARRHHGAVLLLLASVKDRNGAEALRGTEILIPESRLPEPGDDEIYLYQLMGLTVLDVSESETGQVLGTIADVSDHAGQELWTIRSDGMEDVLLPATPEFVQSFDLETRTVRVTPPPGLVELYRP